MQYQAKHLKAKAPCHHSRVAAAAITAALVPALMAATPAFAASEISFGNADKAQTYKGGQEYVKDTWSWKGGENDSLVLNGYKGGSIIAKGDLTVEAKKGTTNTVTRTDTDYMNSEEDNGAIKSEGGSVTIKGGGTVDAARVSADKDINVQGGTTLDAGYVGAGNVNVKDSTLNATSIHADNSKVDASNKSGKASSSDAYDVSGLNISKSYADNQYIGVTGNVTSGSTKVNINNSDVHFSQIRSGYSSIEAGAGVTSKSEAEGLLFHLERAPRPTITVNGVTHNATMNSSLGGSKGFFLPYVDYTFDLAASDGSVTIGRNDKSPIEGLTVLPANSVKLGDGDLKISITKDVNYLAKPELRATDRLVRNFYVTKVGTVEPTPSTVDGYYTFTFNVGAENAGYKAIVYIDHDNAADEVLTSAVDANGNVVVKTRNHSLFTIRVTGERTSTAKTASTISPSTRYSGRPISRGAEVRTASSAAASSDENLPRTGDTTSLALPSLLAALGLVSVACARHMRRD